MGRLPLFTQGWRDSGAGGGHERQQHAKSPLAEGRALSYRAAVVFPAYFGLFHRFHVPPMKFLSIDPVRLSLFLVLCTPAACVLPSATVAPQMMAMEQFLALCTPAAWVLPSATVAPRMMDMELEGHFGASETGSAIESDLDSLGLGGSDGSFSPRIDLAWLGVQLSLSSLGMSYSGRGETDVVVEFDGIRIVKGARVDSALDIGMTTAALTWDLVPGDRLDLGIGFGVTLLDLEVDITEIASSEGVDVSETFPVPHVAATGVLRFGDFGVGADIAFMDVSVDDVDLTWLDYDLHASYHLFRGAERLSGRLVLGYRSIDIDASYVDGNTDVTTDLALTGPYFGVSFSF